MTRLHRICHLIGRQEQYSSASLWLGTNYAIGKLVAVFRTKKPFTRLPMVVQSHYDHRAIFYKQRKWYRPFAQSGAVVLSSDKHSTTSDISALGPKISDIEWLRTLSHIGNEKQQTSQSGNRIPLKCIATNDIRWSYIDRTTIVCRVNVPSERYTYDIVFQLFILYVLKHIKKNNCISQLRISSAKTGIASQ